MRKATPDAFARGNPLRLIRTNRLAKLLDVDQSTIWRWRQTGVLPEPIQIGGVRGWLQPQLEELLAKSQPKTRRKMSGTPRPAKPRASRARKDVPEENTFSLVPIEIIRNPAKLSPALIAVIAGILTTARREHRNQLHQKSFAAGAARIQAYQNHARSKPSKQQKTSAGEGGYWQHFNNTDRTPPDVIVRNKACPIAETLRVAPRRALPKTTDAATQSVHVADVRHDPTAQGHRAFDRWPLTLAHHGRVVRPAMVKGAAAHTHSVTCCSQTVVIYTVHQTRR